MRVGNEDILIPTMMVGNYPKPRWFSGNPNAAVPFGEYLPDSISFETFEDCIAAMVSDQERAGLDVISDGRVLGGDSPYAQIVEYFVERLGYDKYGPAAAAADLLDDVLADDQRADRPARFRCCSSSCGP